MTGISYIISLLPLPDNSEAAIANTSTPKGHVKPYIRVLSQMENEETKMEFPGKKKWESTKSGQQN